MANARRSVRRDKIDLQRNRTFACDTDSGAAFALNEDWNIDGSHGSQRFDEILHGLTSADKEVEWWHIQIWRDGRRLHESENGYDVFSGRSVSILLTAHCLF